MTSWTSGNEARAAIQNGVSPADFSKSVIQSERYKSQPIIGGATPEDVNGGDPFGNMRGLGALVVASEEYRTLLARGGSLPKGKSLTIDLPHNNILEFRNAGRFRNAAITSTGLTAIEKGSEITYLGLQPVAVADACGQFTTTAATVRYIKETSFTNAAAPVAEGAAKPEQAFAFAEVDAVVRKIAAWTTLSDEVIADQVRMAAFVQQKLLTAVSLTLDTQIVSGDGTGNNLRGILSTSGIQTQAKGIDTNLDAIFKAITKIRSVGFLEPDAVVINPNDWQLLKLFKDGNNQYYGGGPMFQPYGVAPYVPWQFVWGLPAIITTAITAGTALVGAFKISAEVYMRQGITIDMTNSDQDDFIKNLTTMRCELRATLAVPHPQGFCTVTGVA